MFPKNLARCLIETYDALETPIAFRRAKVRNEDTPVGHGRPGIAASELGSPGDFETVLGERIEDTRFVPHPEAAGASPLGPILGCGEFWGC